jgi:hypothetical protein
MLTGMLRNRGTLTDGGIPPPFSSSFETGGAALLARGTALLLQFEEEAIENEARDAEVERESEALRPYSKNK